MTDPDFDELVLGVVRVWRVEDGDVGAAVEVGGAALSARAPRAVAEAGEVLDLRRLAGHRLRVKVGHERGHGRVDVQRHQEQQRGESAAHGHRQRRRHVELEPLKTGARRPWRRRRRLRRRLAQRPVQQQLRTAAVHCARRCAHLSSSHARRTPHSSAHGPVMHKQVSMLIFRFRF